MAEAQVSFQNYAAGELSPRMRGRYELPVYQHGFEQCQNFLVDTQGPARYRNGSRYVVHTRRNNVANLIKFQFSNSQSYVLEFTDKYLRFYRNDGVITEDGKTITGITQADPGVVTATSHGFSDGDEVFITGVVGMTEVSGKFFLVANKTANTFELTDQDGVNVDTSGFTAYGSAGTAARIYEIATPYDEDDDLFEIRVAQNADVMYVVHPDYEPRKLTRSGHTSWALALFTRTADPFLDKKTITGATQANPCVITSASHGYSNGDIVIIEGVVGMTELNGKYYTVANQAANTFELSGIDSSGFTAYSSGGYASLRNLLPGAVAFHDARIAYAVIESEPLAFKMSRAPDNNGATRYDDFTNGTDADHAIEFSIAGKDESAIQWCESNEKFLALGTFSGVYGATGDQEDQAITPTSIKVRRVTSIGASYVNPITLENVIIFSERQNRTIRSFEFDALLDNFIAVDKNIISDHITKGLVKQMTYQNGRPDIVWVVKEDGALIAMTFKPTENVSAWHRHKTRTDDLFLSCVTVPRTGDFDRLWVVVEREIDGTTRRYVEYFEDEAVIPETEDFFTAESAQDDDDAIFKRAMFEAQRSAFHVDAGLTYDGSAASIASTTMTPGATTGASVTFTAGAAIFATTDVGRQIWKKAVNGVGTGRATILEYLGTTTVRCKITEDFDSVTAMAAEGWYFTTDNVTNLDHLEGESVKIIADGSVHPAKTIASGEITLDYQAGVVHVGIGYTGIIKTMNIEVGGVNGPAQTKNKNVNTVGLRFHNTLGAKVGTDLYQLETINYRSGADLLDRPAPLFSGDRRIPISGGWQEQKHVYVVQQEALPCTVQLLEPYAQVANR